MRGPSLEGRLALAITSAVVVAGACAAALGWGTSWRWPWPLLPLLLLAVAMPSLVRRVVRAYLDPVRLAARAFDERRDRDLALVPEASLPLEMRPLVASINGVLGRVQASMALQRRFIASAAHELRSPITALSLQVDRLESHPLTEASRPQVEAVRRGLARTRAVSEQLLSFARIQDDDHAVREPASLLAATVSVLEDLMPFAIAKDIDLGLTARDDVRVNVGDAELRVLIRNLIDNAIRHTPAQGRIDVAVAAHPNFVSLVVTDTGTGIPAADLARAFEPFQRLGDGGTDRDGAGLGLSIVDTIARRRDLLLLPSHAAPRPPHGLRFEVRFPLADAPGQL
jgi:two-component system OmpR family sensor kinase